MTITNKTFSHRKDLPILPVLIEDTQETGRHYITPNGVRLPSVTTVLGYASKDHIQEWQNRIGHNEAKVITNRAGNRGTKFHNLLESYVKNEFTTFDSTIMPDMKYAFKVTRPALDRIDNIHYVEAQLFSESLGVAGRSDVIGEYDGVPSIIDFKTSLKLKKKEWITSYFEQKTAYSIMYEDMTGIRIDNLVTIISVDNESEPQVFLTSRNDYTDSLKQKITTYQKEVGNVL